ncbi:nitrilase-related carbon-nitrogen hydrolase [Chloroflexota bacterium]
MIKPYFALALQVGQPCIFKREAIKRVVLPHLSYVINYSMGLANWELPIRLVALPEGAFEGFAAEYTMDYADFCKEMVAKPIPNEETDLLGEIAKRHNVYIMACRKMLDPEIIEGRYFNTAFLISPEGKVILKHHKLQVITKEGSITPQDVWDAYVKKYGDGLDAFFQVVDTDIGRIGLTICMEGSFPEIYRGFAMQGAEIMYRPSYPNPWGSGPGLDWWEIQNRARALDNNFYMICPATGPRYGDDIITPFYSNGGSMIVDYRGQLLSHILYGTEGYACSKINIEELRDHRDRVLTIGNWLPTIRSEYYRKIYEKPIYPRNTWLKNRKTWDKDNAVIKESISRLQEQGIYTPPSK